MLHVDADDELALDADQPPDEVVHVDCAPAAAGRVDPATVAPADVLIERRRRHCRRRR